MRTALNDAQVAQEYAAQQIKTGEGAVFVAAITLSQTAVRNLTMLLAIAHLSGQLYVQEAEKQKLVDEMSRKLPQSAHAIASYEATEPKEE